jgi:hypothetical protein
MHHDAEPGFVTTASQQRTPYRAASILLASTLIAACPLAASAQDVSNPATLQLFEARWQTIEARMIDVFYAGYGAMWLPPPGRADSGDQSVGYDVYDRFDLGDETRATGYGTQTGLITTINQSHNASVNVYTDLILNHNGFSDLGTVDTKGTPSTADDVTFLQAGGYPGFALSLPGDIDGDYHGAFEGGDLNGRLSGLIDIAQDKSHAFIRHPVTPGDPNNIPAGTASAFGRLANVPDASNAQYYPDQGIPGTQIDVDPGPGEFFITRYNFNTDNPMAGDATVETAEQLLMRHAQWMIQVIGVDGFRIDAAKHFPESTLDMLDQAVFRASNQTLLDGSIKPTFSFSEVLDGNKNTVQTYINRGLTNKYAIAANDFQVKGNRDALDFPLFYAMRDNLTGVDGNNNWHNIRYATQDTELDGLRNGSQGVSFVNSHDNLAGGFPYLENVAYAYTLMRPGDTVVYHNAKEFGGGRDFPNDGRDDALGGFGSDTVTTLVNLRNTHGRGNFHERWVDDAFNPNGFSNIYIYERGNAAIIGLSSHVSNVIETRNGVQTEFAPGTRLVELTGNAADPVVDPGNAIPETVLVDGTGKINVSIPSNGTHGKGYVIYGLQNPQGAVSIPDKTSTKFGAGSASQSAAAIINDYDIIKSNTFTVRLNTNAVTLPGGFRDADADGDFAALKIDEGVDVNGNGVVDFTTPGSVTYGFENFVTTNNPGFGSVSGNGLYEQTIDANQLAEGYHFITTRAFRHRADGGPAIFNDFKRVVYVDLLPPDSAVDSFELNGTGTGNMNLIMRSVDKTAQAVFVYLDLPANATEAEILDIDPSQNTTIKIDRDLFRRGYINVKDGNHVVTILTVEQTGTFNIQRFAGLTTSGANGAGVGDLNSDNVFSPADLNAVPNGFKDILYSRNDKFHAAADVNADGLVDSHDLFALEAVLINSGADQPTLDAYAQVLLGRGDLNNDSLTNAADIDFIRTQFGSTDWLLDLDVSGITDNLDEVILIENIFKTGYGDVNLDGAIDQLDLDIAGNNQGQSGLGWGGGDVDGDGLTGIADLNIILANLTAIPGDLNADGFVGIQDLNIVLGNWNQNVTPGDFLQGDPSGDGFVGIQDLNTVLGNWNAGTPPTESTNIPEPGTALLLSFTALIGLQKRYR